MSSNNILAATRTALRNWLATDLYRWYLRVLWGMDIGQNARVSLSAYLDRSYPKLIHIGRDTNIARRVAIFCHDDVRRVWSDTHIGERCLIGAYSIIAAGVRVGDGSVVSAGSVVVSDIPAGSLASGNPARVVEMGIVTGPFGAILSRGAARGDRISGAGARPSADIDAKIAALMREILLLEPGFALAELAYNDTATWDSVAHMTLMAGLENEFDITLEAEEILSMNNFASIRATVGQHLGAGSNADAV